MWIFKKSNLKIGPGSCQKRKRARMCMAQNFIWKAKDFEWKKLEEKEAVRVKVLRKQRFKLQTVFCQFGTISLKLGWKFSLFIPKPFSLQNHFCTPKPFPPQNNFHPKTNLTPKPFFSKMTEHFFDGSMLKLNFQTLKF